VNIVFVAQKGALSIKALLLAWSLRQTHGDTLGLYAACPDYKDWGQLGPECEAALARLRVKKRVFTPPFAPEYPIGNKVRVLSLLPDDEPGLFLDSDMLSLTAWSTSTLLPDDCSAAAKPVDLSTWGNTQCWQTVYTALDMPLPRRRMQPTVMGAPGYPYFNAGVVACRSPGAFAQHWERNTRILSSPGLPLEPRYPWLDQIALAPLLTAKTAQVLDESWNFPAHMRVLPDTGVNLCHYHSPGVILREPRLLRLVNKALRQLPELRKMMQATAEWRPVLRPALPANIGSLRRRDFIITGVPRSGTSLVASLLDRQRNWLVLNEPREVFDRLSSRPDASGVALLHREVREKVLSGQPIENKTDGQEVITNTAELDQRTLYHPQLQNAGFRLGSKNTLAYMASLDNLKSLDWPIVAMIRHPLDALQSWSDTFEHLREVQLQQLPAAVPGFHGWHGWQRKEMERLLQYADPALRRVLFWRLLARTLLGHEGIHLWHYERLVQDPRAHLRRLRWHMRAPGLSRLPTEPLRQRIRTVPADLPERIYLGDLCRTELKELGYEL
jgi:hypothetical protein